MSGSTDLFAGVEEGFRPLADRMRPRTLEEFVGQQSVVGEGTPLRQAIENDRLHSMIFWGPPGVGKTSLALFIAEQLKRPFHLLSAVSSGVKDVRKVIEEARSQRFFDQPSPILFIDEIHRFSKSQQDALLHAVEKGIITLIGATTENPSFEVISALLSRCQLFVLNEMTKEDLQTMLLTAIETDSALKSRQIELKQTDLIIRYSGGDARKLYNALEMIVNAHEDDPVVITNKLTSATLTEHISRYDKSGEQHYDIISAFIKSIRGSDPNAG